MSKILTEQEKFWSGEFGDKYAARNRGDVFYANLLAFFSRILSNTEKINSVIEYGANIGENLRALSQLLPKAKLEAVEINKSASEEIIRWSNGSIKVYNKSVLDFRSKSKRDLVFVKGMLIHINPKKLGVVYNILYETSSKYILIGEYYNQSPVGIDYRGNKNKLFKRDFCGEIMNKYPDLKLVDYGFVYHRDPIFPQDDITWFLLEK